MGLKDTFRFDFRQDCKGELLILLRNEFPVVTVRGKDLYDIRQKATDKSEYFDELIRMTGNEEMQRRYKKCKFYYGFIAQGLSEKIAV